MTINRLVLVAVVAVLASACSSDRQPAEPETAVPPPSAATPPAEATSGERAEPDRPEPGEPAHELAAGDARAATRGTITTGATASGVNVQAAVLEDFQRRVGSYLELHKKAERDGGKPKQTESPTVINDQQELLASRIAALRAGAKHGDVFTPEIRDSFRRLLAPELKGEEGRDTKEVLKDDAPPSGSVPLQVNAKYPDGLPRPTLPANLLLNLPSLPKGLEYRIVGKHLVLLDIDANLIVDYIANAIA
jgi:hypothetical protein